MTGDERAAVVAKALRAHSYLHVKQCRCGESFRDMYDQRAHIAAAVVAALDAQPGDAEQICECVPYTIRTDYGTGTEHDLDRSSCPIHGNAGHPCMHCGRARSQHGDRGVCMRAGFYGNRYDAGDGEQAGGLTKAERDLIIDTGRHVYGCCSDDCEHHGLPEDAQIQAVQRIIAARAAAAPGADAVRALDEVERLDLAEYMRRAFDTPPDRRPIADTWLNAAAAAERWFREVRAAADTGGERGAGG